MANTLPSLDGLTLAQTRVQHHTLHLNFPATDLLPPNTVPWLEPPRNLVYREQPCLNTFLLEADNLGFFHRFRVQSETANANSLCEFGDGCESLISTLESLQYLQAGHSKLDFVAYEDEIEGIIYLFRLCASLSPPKPGVPAIETTLFFHFHKLQLEPLYTAAETHAWADLILSLIERSTDRAYLHVQQNLHSRHPGAALACDMLYASHWGSRWPPTPQQMVKRSMACQDQGGNAVTLLSDLDDENLRAHADERLEVWLPCGCKTSVTIRGIEALSEPECLTLECNECNRLVLTSADRDTLGLEAEQAIRDEYAQFDLYWAGLDEPIPVNDTQAADYSTAKVFEALLEALDTLRVPESTSPASLCPARFPETLVILAGLRDMLQSAQAILSVCPAELVAMLERTAVSAITSYCGEPQAGDLDLPPGYRVWLSRWMRRTVNSLTGGSRKRTKEAVASLGPLLEKARVD